MNIEYRQLSAAEITPALFADFDRYQNVTKCLRYVNGEWVVRDIAFVEHWGAAEFAELSADLIRTDAEGGMTFAAFADGRLKGFSTVLGRRTGSRNQYMILESMHVSYDMRGHGMGRRLFDMAADWARAQGVEKLYISSHSAVESQAFYAAMGCVDAAELDAESVAKEPYDRQLELKL